MMYPSYGDAEMIGGNYSLMGRMCQWEITAEGDKQVLRIYGDCRYEGKSFSFSNRLEALEAAGRLIYAEVA